MSQSLLVSATGTVSGIPCTMKGFYVNSTAAGTLVFRDGGASGEAKTGTITPSVGWNDLPILFTKDLHVTVGGAISVNVLFDR